MKDLGAVEKAENLPAKHSAHLEEILDSNTIYSL